MSEFLPVINAEWFVALGSILLINLILSGDNAVIIALASKNLPHKQRNLAVLWGSAGAVILRILLTFIAASLLDVPYLQFIGGVLLLWIALNLLGNDHGNADCKEASSLKEAIKIILFADLIMSLDNVLALAAVAQTLPDSKYSLIIVGLLTSIPLVVFGAQLLMKLMDRFPVIIYIGAAVLGYAAAEMLTADKGVGPYLQPYATILEIGAILLVLGWGYFQRNRRCPQE